jgi:hypothetical protein
MSTFGGLPMQAISDQISIWQEMSYFSFAVVLRWNYVETEFRLFFEGDCNEKPIQ